MYVFLRGVTALAVEGIVSMALCGNVLTASDGDAYTRATDEDVYASTSTLTASDGDTSVRMERAREELVCAICFETFREPRTLACQHTFCTECLKQLSDTAHRKHSSATTIDCPECRANMILPKNGIYGKLML